MESNNGGKDPALVLPTYVNNLEWGRNVPNCPPGPPSIIPVYFNDTRYHPPNTQPSYLKPSKRTGVTSATRWADWGLVLPLDSWRMTWHDTMTCDVWRVRLWYLSLSHLARLVCKFVGFLFLINKTIEEEARGIIPDGSECVICWSY